jgi:hypothetical protein
VDARDERNNVIQKWFHDNCLRVYIVFRKVQTV